MQKKAVIFSAGEYLNSPSYPKPKLDLQGVKYDILSIDKHGYFHGDDLIFIDADQYFDIGLLDAIWKFRKVDNKVFKDKGIEIPELTEAESKLVSFLGFTRSQKFFTCDESYTWYYNGRQIKMGEIPLF
ncbi:hypothetical protein [Clostridium sp.]|uniref:hypothetical protein n=1 Tax=Clostridium sp. TaxID=1506 RepID=UPI003216EF5A